MCPACTAKILSLKPGDYVVVHSIEVAEQLMKMRNPAINFAVPIIVDLANQGIEKIPRDVLLKAIENG